MAKLLVKAVTACLLAALTLAAPCALEAQERPPRIAITIDDLPWNGPSLDQDAIVKGTRRLLAALETYGVAATGFVVCRRIAAGGAALQLWLDSGMTLGNHSWGHRDLNSTPISPWLDEVRRCDEELRALTGGPVRYFRYPYLHQGTTVERRDAALDQLRALDYRIAHVSVDNSEWVLARPYDEALSRGDSTSAKRIGQLFVTHIIDAVEHYQEVARRKLGRDVDHVLLLHANALVADHLQATLGTLAGRGFQFITLAEALHDPVYARADGYLGPKGLSWLYRVEPATPEAAAWDDRQAASLRRALSAGNE